ncbi:MAG: biotin--[acetyl-CoA-carboxylase] ligase [Phycisphaerales bacterium]|nr:biotin--[acetyl-CoA-carboxylase] ligase [Phycisphaerales bacterium]
MTTDHRATPRPLVEWADALESTIAHCTHWTSVVVLRETASTQDHARRFPIGSVVIAGRQTAGRGRVGREWIDTGEDGLAISMNTPVQCGERLALLCAIAAAEAIEEVCRAASGASPSVRLKWPNDLLISGRKAGGVLIEQDQTMATIGVGINCSQRAFPSSLASRATSLQLQGFSIDRLNIARALLERLDRWIIQTDESIENGFAARDGLVGTSTCFRTPTGLVEGIVLRIDPLQGVVVRTSRGDQHLSSATTSVFVPEDRG